MNESTSVTELLRLVQRACLTLPARLRPRSHSVRQPSTVVSPAVPSSNASVICLLDDDPSVLKGLGRLFSSVDLHAEKFSDPEEFLLYARTHRPAVALLDVFMPLMNGLKVQSQLRKISPSTRVIMFTGKVTYNALVRSAALNGGASAFFSKPFDDEELLTAVRLALTSAK